MPMLLVKDSYLVADCPIEEVALIVDLATLAAPVRHAPRSTAVVGGDVSVHPPMTGAMATIDDGASTAIKDTNAICHERWSKASPTDRPQRGEPFGSFGATVQV
jgi:hypothetical protein